MPIEPVKIPQNVQIEDRIIGPISLRQIVICMIGGGISYVIWNSFKAAGAVNTFNLLMAWTPFTIAAAYAFVKVHNLSLLRITLLLFEKVEKPVIRSFGPREGISINIKAYYRTQAEKGKVSKANLDVTKGKLDNLSNLLDETAHEIDATKPVEETEETVTVTDSKTEKEQESSIIIEEPQGKLAQALGNMQVPKNDNNLMNDIIPPSS